jgi:hypothetical protein
MSTYSGPQIVLDTTVVTNVDFGNAKSFPAPVTGNHGYSQWICLVSGTATYSIIDANVTIFQNTGGTVTTVVSPTVAPQRGSLAVTAGSFYYGNGPVFFSVEDQQHCVAPLSMAGTQFYWNNARNSPGLLYVYAPTATNIYFYSNPANGFNSLPTSVTAAAAGSITLITWVDINIVMFMRSDQPVVATTTQTGADRSILSPMDVIAYNRYNRVPRTTINTVPTAVIGVTGTQGGFIWDNIYPVMDMTIADGAGGDCCQSLGFNYLSNVYSWGNSMSDFGMAFPYPNTTVVVSYWDPGTSAWIVLATYGNVTGNNSTAGGATPRLPVYLYRDGTLGPDVPGTNIAGSAAFFAGGATGPWRWVSNNPFYLCINDTIDDEMSMLGWSTNLYNTTGTANNGVLTGGGTYNLANGGFFEFAGSNYVAFNPTSVASTVELTVSMFVKVTSNPGNYRGFAGGNNGTGNDYQIGFNIDLGPGASASVDFLQVEGAGIAFANLLTTPIAFGQWFYLTVTISSTTTTLYINGVANGSNARVSAAAMAISYLTLGARPVLGVSDGATYAFNGSIAQATVYTRALTAGEVLQNFQALRGRFGI